MVREPGYRTSDKDCIQHQRLVKGQDPDSTESPPGVFLELWEGNHGERSWAVAYLDDHRHHLGDGIRIKVNDDVAGWMKRNFTEPDEQP